MTDDVTPQAAETARPGDPVPGQGPVVLRWLWHGYLRRRWGLLAVAILLMMIEGSMLGALSFMVAPLFDEVFVAGTPGALAWGTLAIAVIFALRAISGLAQRVLVTLIGEGVAARMQTELVLHLMRLDQAFYRVHPPGTLIERVRGDTATVLTFLTGVVAPFGRDLMSLISLLAVTLWIDWRWTLIAAIGTPLLVGPILLLQRLVRATSRAARVAAATAATRLDEIFHGIVTIQLNGIETREAGRFRQVVDRYVAAMVRSEAGASGIPALMDVIAAIGLAGVLVYGGAQIIDGEKTLGEFMAFFTAMALVFEPLRRLGGVSATYQQVLAGLERVHALLQVPPGVTSPTPPRASLPTRQTDRQTGRQTGAIRFEGVRFSYGDAPALRGLDLTAGEHRTTALVGPSGAGKTTVFTLLTRLADPQAGRITIGGHDLRDLDLGTLRGLFSVVSQEAALFDETIRDNILLGQTGISAARLQAALDAAHVTEFLPRLPQGLDTPAGPRGSALSGGQRQRVAIARAILRDAPILLLDEATSALDANTEALVQGALDRLAEGRTTLVIAHRLATVQRADSIAVLDQGRLVDQGSHAALIARGGLYAELCRLQFDATASA
jgi:ABC-type multidrug transport system fused ATPase/permease subunit